MAPDCLEKLVDFLDKNLEAAVVAPALYKPVILNCHSERSEESLSGRQIDSLGLKIWRSRRVTEITELKSDDNAFEVFGVSCAVAMFRRPAATEALIDGELFDSSFFLIRKMWIWLGACAGWALRLFVAPRPRARMPGLPLARGKGFGRGQKQKESTGNSKD